MSCTEEDERRAHIENMQVDSDYKRTLTRWEPWKVIIAAVVASAAIAGFVGYKIGATPPAPIIIQIPPAPAAAPGG